MGLNIVYGFYKFYWIVRDTAKPTTPRVCIGWVHELGGYWRKGKGPQIKLSRYILQFGVCSKTTVASEDDGYLAAVEGRVMDTTTREISAWH